MNLLDILQLNIEQESIKHVDSFLTSAVKNSEDYFKAIVFKANILHHIGKTNEAIRLLYSFVSSFNELNNECIIIICDAIIDITLDIDRLDQVNTFISLKNRYLPLSKSQSHIKDLIKLSLKNKNYYEAKTLILKYLEDDLEKEDEVYALDNLGDIYISERQYSKYMEIAPRMEALFYSLRLTDKLTKLSLNKIKISFDSGNYLKVISDGNIFFGEGYHDNDSLVYVAALVIKSYVMTNDCRAAAIIESEYEEFVDTAPKEYGILFCRYAAELYQKTNTVLTANSYLSKLQELSNLPDSKEKKGRKKTYNIPTIADNIEVKEFKNPKKISQTTIATAIETKTANIKEIIVSENYDTLSNVFNAIATLNCSSKFREVFRIACINICKVFDIKEAYCLYFKREYLGLHYKVERAYDKKLTFEQIENTLNFEAINYESEIFLDPECDYLKNIVTGKNYEEDTYGIAYPISIDEHVIGSIAFFNDHEFLGKEMVYESLKLISSMLNFKLNMSLKQEYLEHDNNKLFFLSEATSSGMKDQIDDYIHLSKQATEMLGCMSDMNVGDYYAKIESKYLPEYRRIIEEIYTIMSSNVEYTYQFNGKNGPVMVKERFYPIYINGVICIYSIIDNITEEEKIKSKLQNIAYTNPVSHLDTEVKLVDDLKKFMCNRKVALAIFEIRDFNLYKDIYGLQFSNELKYAVGKTLKEILSSDFNSYSYHLDGNQYAIVLNDVNDKRLVDSKLNLTFKKLSDKLFEINSRVKLSFDCGVFRLAKNSTINDPMKLISLTVDALQDAIDMVEPSSHIAHFDSEAHKIRFNHNQLITHISEAIDHGKMSVTYQQIVNLGTNEVMGYYARLNLDNFDVEYEHMDYVIRRRHLTNQLERYLISSVLKDEKLLYDRVKQTVPIIIPLSNVSIDETFYSFVSTNITFFKVKPESIILLVDNANKRVLQEIRKLGVGVASQSIVDVYNSLCDHYFYDKTTNGFESVFDLQALCTKNNISMVITGIDTKEDIDYCYENNINRIFGKYYKKLIRMKALVEKLS